MNQLDAAKTEEQGNEEGLDFVLSDTRVDLLENKVVLAVPDDNPADIQSFKDLATDKLTLLCIGNEDVPVGAYSEEILNALEILDALKAANKITYGTNVKEVTTQVKEGTVDAGIIYATDAYSAELTVVDDSGSDYCSPVIYPAAVMKGTANEEAAKAFLDYLQSAAAMKIFREVGFRSSGNRSERTIFKQTRKGGDGRWICTRSGTPCASRPSAAVSCSSWGSSAPITWRSSPGSSKECWT